MTIESYHIPANFTDAGKIMGAFAIRNTIEAVVLTVPLAFGTFVSLPFDITAKIIFMLVIAIPVGGFALIGINDDSLTIFLKTWLKYRKRRLIISYRGTPTKKKKRKTA